MTIFELVLDVRFRFQAKFNVPTVASFMFFKLLDEFC